MEDAKRGSLRRRAAHQLMPRQRDASVATTATVAPPKNQQQTVTVVRTATGPAPAAATSTTRAAGPAVVTVTSTPTTVPVGGFTSVVTQNGVAFTIVVQQVGVTTPSSSSSPSSSVVPSTSFSNPFFSLPTPSNKSSTSSAVTVQTVTANENTGTGTLAQQSGIINPTINRDSAGGLSTGAIVGIAIGAFAAVVLALALCFWAVGAYRDRRARQEVTDMMGTSNLPDPYAGAFISREVPGSFVRFNDDDDMGSFGGGDRPTSAYGGPAGAGNAYDDMSVQDDDYGDAAGSSRPLSPFRGSRAYAGTY